MGKEVTLRILFCLESFQMMANGERKFLLFFPSVNYRRIFSIHLKNSRFVEDVLFYPENEVMAFPKIEIKWDWVSDLHVYVKSDAVIWFWRCCHVRTRQTSENQITDRTCVVQTNSRVNGVGSTVRWVNLIVWLVLSYFQRYFFILSTRFVQTSENGLSHKT